jgi:hypothetical protein
MHIHFFTFVILAVISSLLSVLIDRRFVRNRRPAQAEAQPAAPSTQSTPEV